MTTGSLLRRCRYFAASLLILAWGLCASAPAARAQATVTLGAAGTTEIAFGQPVDVTSDSQGNLYFTDHYAGSGSVNKMTLSGGNYTETTLVSGLTTPDGLNTPYGIAVDGAGDVFFVLANSIHELTPNGAGGYNQTTLPVSVLQYSGIALDAAGNLFYTDNNNGNVLKLAPPYNGTPVNIASGIYLVYPIATDAAGNVYFINYSGNIYKDTVSGSSYTLSIVASGFPYATGLAVDSAGNLYVQLNGAVTEEVLSNGTYSPVTLATGLYYPWGIGLDPSGHIFVCQDVNLVELQIGVPPTEVAGTSAALPVTFTFTAAAATGATAPAATGDFAAGGGSCAASTAYTAGSSCNVNVTFSPTLAGAREGAVELLGTGGAPIATAFLQGTGLGPQIVYAPGTEISVGPATQGIDGVAIGNDGSIYSADNTDSTVTRTLPGGGSVTVAQTAAHDNINGIAVDGAGNVYLDDQSGHAVTKESPSGSGYTPSTVATNVTPTAVAVDGSGSVYLLADDGVLKLTPGATGYTQTTVETGAAGALAVDAAGDVYVADVTTSSVYKESPAPAGAYSQTTVATGVSSTSLAVDGFGNVYILDEETGQILKETVNGSAYTQSVALSGVQYGSLVAVDASGNLYVVNGVPGYGQQISELNLATAPTLNFSSTNVGSDSSAQSVTVTNAGNQPLNFSGLSIAANFAQTATTPGPDCSATAQVNPNASCTLAIEFQPTTGGTISGSAQLTDNNLNATTPPQSISLNGVGVETRAAQNVIFHSPGAYLSYGTVITLGATASSGLAVTYSVTGPASLSGSQLTVTAGSGNVSVTATQAGNNSYQSASATIGFGALPAQMTLTASSGTMVYGTTPPTISAIAAPLVNGDTLASFSALTCSTLATSTSNVGSYASSCSATDPNYFITTVAGSVSVTKASSTVTWTPPATSIVYGTPLAAELDATGTGAVTYAIGTTTVTAATVLPAATTPYSITATSAGDGNHTGSTATAALTIAPAPLTLTASSGTMVYGTTPPTISAIAAPLVNGDTLASLSALTCSTNATSTSNVGSYASICSATDPNYVITPAAGSVTVTKASSTITWTPPGTSIVYGTPLAAELDAAGTGAVTYAIGTTAVTAATVLPAVPTPYLITATSAGDGNHTGATATLGLTVNPAPLTLTASSGTMVYGTTPPAITAVAAPLVNGDTLASLTGLTCSTLATSTSNVGSYASTCSATDPNYVITPVAGSVSVTKATSTVIWTPPAATIVYGTPLGAELDASGTGAVTYAIGTTTVTAATVLPAATAQYSITATSVGDGNHTGASTTVALSVTPAPLTLTASSGTMVYGTTPPTISAIAAPLVNGDTLASLSALTCSTTATSTSNVASYPSSCSATDPNYTIIAVSGTVVVTPAPQAIVFAPIANQVFNGEPYTIPLTATASSGLQVSFAVTGPATLVTAGNAITINAPGAVTVTATQAGDNDFLAAPAATQSLQTNLGLAYGLFATAAGCDSMTLDGHVFVNSYDSSQGAFPAGVSAANGNLGSNGTLTLRGDAVIEGALYDPNGGTRDHDCDWNHPASLVSDGHAQLSGGIISLPSALTYPTPVAPNPLPPTADQLLGPGFSRGCNSIAGCSVVGDNHLALAPSAYGNLTVVGNVIVDLQAGTYNLNRLRLSGGASLRVVSGPVTLNLAGAANDHDGDHDAQGDVLDITGGAITNPGVPSNLVILYGGLDDVELSSGSLQRPDGDHCDGDHDADDRNCSPQAGLSAVVYAPNARVTLSGGTVFSGAIVGRTITASGGVIVHYDRALGAMAAFSGGTPPPATDQGHQHWNDTWH